MTVFDLSKTEQFTLFESLKETFTDPEKSFDFPSLEQKYGIELDPDIRAFLEGCKEQNTYIDPKGSFPLSIDCDKSTLSIAAYISFENYNACATTRMNYSVDGSKQYEYHDRSGDLVKTNSLNECMDSFKEKCNTYSLYSDLISVANESVKEQDTSKLRDLISQNDFNPHLSELADLIDFAAKNDFSISDFHYNSHINENILAIESYIDFSSSSMDLDFDVWKNVEPSGRLRTCLNGSMSSFIYGSDRIMEVAEEIKGRDISTFSTIEQFFDIAVKEERENFLSYLASNIESDASPSRITARLDSMITQFKISPEIKEFAKYCKDNGFKVQASHESDSDTITVNAEKDGQVLGMTTDGKDCYFDYRDDFSNRHTRSFDHVKDFIDYYKNEPARELEVLNEEKHKPKHNKNRDIDFGR